METKNLKSAIKVHFSEVFLSSDKINTLLENQECILSDIEKNTKKNSITKRHFFMITFAAAILIGVILYPPFFYQNDLTHQIATEVAYNHHKLKDPEIFSNSYSAVQGKLHRLDFTIIPSKLLSPALILIGGRYCSIKGVLAAQLRYRHSDTGKTFTVYQAPSTKDYKTTFKNLQETQIDGITVKIWQEKGLLVAEAN